MHVWRDAVLSKENSSISFDKFKFHVWIYQTSLSYFNSFYITVILNTFLSLPTVPRNQHIECVSLHTDDLFVFRLRPPPPTTFT